MKRRGYRVMTTGGHERFLTEKQLKKWFKRGTKGFILGRIPESYGVPLPLICPVCRKVHREP